MKSCKTLTPKIDGDGDADPGAMSNDMACDGGVAAVFAEACDTSGVSLSSQYVIRLRLLGLVAVAGRGLLECSSAPRVEDMINAQAAS